MIPTEHHVKIGQIKMGRPGEILKTVLGSCVGIGLIWKRKNIYALAHCLLPENEKRDAKFEARYVNQAIPRMLELLGVTGEEVLELEAIVAGGGQMMAVDKAFIKFVVGTENLKTAKRHLAQSRIRVVAFEPGGVQGTKMRLDCETGNYEISRIDKVG